MLNFGMVERWQGKLLWFVEAIRFCRELRCKLDFARMNFMEKTVKIRTFSDGAKSDALQGKLADDQDKSLELAMKDAQLEEEKSRSLEHLKTIVQLRESLKQERTKTAELEANVLAKKNTQLEEEKGKSLEHLRMIVQLRESLKQEQAKTAEMAKKAAGLEAKAKELAVLETRVKEMTEALSKISSVAAAGKAG